MARKRKQYDDKFRASAVVMLEAAGYPDTKGALTKVSKSQGVPPPTLHRWFHGKNNPPPSDIVNENRPELAEMFRAEIYAVFDGLDTARELADYRELIIGLGILFDKLQLLENKPTERVEHDVTINDSRERLARLIADRVERQRSFGDTELTH